MDTTLQQLSYLAEIIIGIATVYSLYLSRKAIEKSDWNSALMTVPSLVIRPMQIYITINGGVCNIGEEIKKIKEDTRKITFNINFENFNAGRGAAFNIKKPIATDETFLVKNYNYRRIPLHQSLEDEPFEFSIQITKSFEQWAEFVDKKIPISIEIKYTNDQGNISCISIWKAELQPFELNGSSLILREYRVLNRNSSVKYSPVK
jgi:hypothetical protein